MRSIRKFVGSNVGDDFRIRDTMRNEMVKHEHLRFRRRHELPELDIARVKLAQTPSPVRGTLVWWRYRGRRVHLMNEHIDTGGSALDR